MEAAFFDLDKTIIAKSSLLAFGLPFYREGLLSKSTVIRSAYAQTMYKLVGADENKMEKLRETTLKLTSGWEQAKIAQVVRDALEDIVAPIVFREAFDLFDEHRAAGRKLIIVSSSPVEIVSPLAEYLGVDDHIATRAVIDPAGFYTGEMAFYSYGKNKVVAMKELAERDGIDLAKSFAYSDSITDLPMLEAVGHPVAVNPDKELAAIATERDWEIREFRHPVRLRDRMPLPTTPKSLAISSVALVTGTAFVTYRWMRRGITRQG